jgi:hypothetical protein
MNASALSPKTLAAHQSLLYRIQDHLKLERNPTDMGCLTRRHKAVKKFIMDSDLSQRTKLSYIGWVVGMLRQAKKNPKAYLDLMNELIEERSTDDEQERELQISWDEVLNIYEKLKEERTQSFLHYRDYLLLSLYVLEAPRRNDYASVPIVGGQPDGGNYLLYPSCTFYLNEYKTVKKYGPQVISFGRDLTSIIMDFVRRYDAQWLLPNIDGTGMTEAQVSRRMGDVFERLAGKRAGINALRHAYVSDQRKGEKPVKEKRALANAMLHSLGMNELYRRGL